MFLFASALIAKPHVSPDFYLLENDQETWLLSIVLVGRKHFDSTSFLSLHSAEVRSVDRRSGDMVHGTPA